MGGHQLLLLTDRVQEPERVDAEADDPESGHHEECDRAAHRGVDPFAGPGRGEHQEREQQPGCDLDADARRQRAGSGPQARAGAGGQREREREREDHERVVVRAADREDQQDGVQADEGGGEARALAKAPGGPRDERDRAEAGGDGGRLERPQAAGEAQWDGRIAGEREDGAVGRVLEGPADEGEGGIGGGFGGHVGVGVQPVQRTHACERQIAEDVL